METSNLYLGLMKRALSNYLYWGGDTPFEHFEVGDFFHPGPEVRLKVPEIFKPHSLLATPKLNALHGYMYDIVMNKVPGDFIEAGIYRGGTTIFMRAFLKVYDIKDRLVWAADSFEGIPKSDKYAHINDPVDDWEDRFSAGYEEVEATFKRYDLLDNQVRFVKGFFAEALPQAPIEQLALARLDADSYESTMDALEQLYPKMSPGGYVVIDDWHIETCRRAVQDYRDKHGITEPVHFVLGIKDEHAGYEAFWRVAGKSSNPVSDQ